MIGEDKLALRIASIREARGISYGAMSQKLSEVGHPMDKSSIQKLEKGEPRRRICVDDVAAISKVLDVPVADLLELPTEKTVLSSSVREKLMHIGDEIKKIAGE
ncbi:helix-turn-helix transcriptional regulator [Glutamicibacter protophormiae]|uniref:helix-turn-helix domain-containing protein n=1 Tax=Glutamicibacter protophormiae TaxID=37930 RepID=UPI002A7EE94D|nr:helix-turn-helix transcriptional regulator [Glutamicibacter protophormiae]WPR65242.1 helix-turn-helix transcriptional regulator [Glutamicibacter protophormiae]WPR68739.1 helix-turn-helix transcriptional regulator [Glutamicibacter protophormiae]